MKTNRQCALDNRHTIIYLTENYNCFFKWYTIYIHLIKTSPKGFLASKCDVGNWIFSKLGIFEKFVRNSLEIFGGFFWNFFWRNLFGGFLEGFCLEDVLGGFFGGILCLHCESQLSHLNMKGIDAFVKILSQWRRKEGNFNP